MKGEQCSGGKFALDIITISEKSKKIIKRVYFIISTEDGNQASVDVQKIMFNPLTPAVSPGCDRNGLVKAISRGFCRKERVS
jgi:hypothetical protein